ncbi:MAG: glycosyltransferase family A protein, partial [Acidobacteriota bacterium]
MYPTAFACDLVLHGEPTDWPWSLGRKVACASTTDAVADAVDALMRKADAAPFLLTWDARLGVPPDPDRLASIVATGGDVWHAGLCLGQAGRPQLLDFVHPTWMLNADPVSDRPATSWRISLQACLARATVWRQGGGPDSSYRELASASLELGHRWLWGGAVLRHVPFLVDGSSTPEHDAAPLDPADALRFLLQRTSTRWALWALVRAVSARLVGPMAAWRAWRAVTAEASRRPSLVIDAVSQPATDDDHPSVSVLIPTVDRYPWLDVLLGQLRAQTVAPLEILVVDQTAPLQRRDDWTAYDDLPLTVLPRDRAGQCSSRNAGLRHASGDAILFLDDDDEIEPDLIERHLDALVRSGADAICGVADEVAAGPLPVDFQRRRLSDVFPTNNTLLRRDALVASGLFDLAFETGSRADADLGQRLYQSGALLLLEPSIRVLHHHAPSGGLRRHKARAVTYAASRRQIRVRHLPSVTELYLARRHFSPRQVREADLLRVLGTF